VRINASRHHNPAARVNDRCADANFTYNLAIFDAYISFVALIPFFGSNNAPFFISTPF